jgi:predicted ABC-type transport system involved in lysophospholipase L1 biosynthesis ATPase subunit
VVVTHDPAVASRAHRLLRMRDGRIVEEAVQ